MADTDADRIDAAPVFFGLRMYLRIAVDLAVGGLQNVGRDALGETKHVDCVMHACLDRLHAIELLVNRTDRVGEIENAIDLDVEREGDIVTDQFELRVIEQVRDIAFRSREEIIQAENIVTVFDKAIAQVRAEEAGAAGDQNLIHDWHSRVMLYISPMLILSPWAGFSKAMASSIRIEFCRRTLHFSRNCGRVEEPCVIAGDAST